MIQSFLASPDAIVNSMQQLDFVLNGIMPAKWRDRIVKFLKKHIQLAQDHARQEAAARDRKQLENQLAASFSASLAAKAAQKMEKDKAAKQLLELVQEEAKRNEPHKVDELHIGRTCQTPRGS